MKLLRLYPFFLVFSVVLMVSIGCSLTSQGSGERENIPMSSSTPIPTSEILPTTVDTPIPQEAETSEPDEPSTATSPPTELPPEPQTKISPCYDEQCTMEGAFLLSRPIGPSGRNVIDPSYRFGELRRGRREPNHGVSFLNSLGTPVLAAANGEVVVAGDDHNKVYGTYPDRYGNLVILKHNFGLISEPVYTVYAHLSEIMVQEGENVEKGQEIGLVGASGDIAGSTLHFEVRLGENSYQAVRNPEMWLENLLDEDDQTRGVIAGRVVNKRGDILLIPSFVIERLAGPGQPAMDTYYIDSYKDKRLTGLAPWEESFAKGDLPPGSYQITFLRNNATYQREVDVQPGQLTFVTFEIEE